MTVNDNDIVFFSLSEITRIIFCDNGKNKYFLVCNPMDGWMDDKKFYALFNSI